MDLGKSIGAFNQLLLSTYIRRKSYGCPPQIARLLKYIKWSIKKKQFVMMKAPI
jgi:hypothetical protein